MNPDERTLHSSECGERSLASLLLGRILPTLCALLIVQGWASSPLEAQSPDYSIEIGHATVFPGASQVSVPVYITNAEPLGAWQMGLDYDDLLLGLIGATTLETVSEPLNAVVFFTGAAPAISSVEVVYPGTDPLPAGVHQLALWLTFELLNPSLVPAGGNVTDVIRIVADPIPITFDLANGGTVVPGISNGTISLYSPPVLKVEASEGTILDQHILVPIQLWSAGPATTLEMGLDYDDLLLCSFTLEGGAFDTALGSSVTATVSAHPQGFTTIVIEAHGGLSLPQLDGDVVGYLDFTVGGPPLNTLDLLAGTFPIELQQGACWIDATEIANTLDGRLEIRPDFLRGDPNFSGTIDISDITTIIDAVFIAGRELPCPEAGDVNDNGSLEVSDVVSLISFIFMGSPPPPLPFPDAGPDPDPQGGLGCF